MIWLLLPRNNSSFRWTTGSPAFCCSEPPEWDPRACRPCCHRLPYAGKRPDSSFICVINSDIMPSLFHSCREHPSNRRQKCWKKGFIVLNSHTSTVRNLHKYGCCSSGTKEQPIFVLVLFFSIIKPCLNHASLRNPDPSELSDQEISPMSDSVGLLFSALFPQISCQAAAKT